jgi:probable F420-dependent oxidoreductase
VRLVATFPSNAYPWGPKGLIDLAKAVEAIGYDTIETYDHVALNHPFDGEPTRLPPDWPCLEPLVTLGMVAAVTERVTLATGIIVLPQRQPALVAKQVATLDVLSGGRTRVGFGLGWNTHEFEAMGVPFANRGKRFEEAIEVMRSYWTSSSVTHEGRYYRAQQMQMEPRPIQRPLPIWIGGGGSDSALDRVGRLADGWIAGRWLEPDIARASIEKVRSAAERAGRDANAIGMQVQLGHGTPGEIARSAEARSAQGFDWGEVDMTTAVSSGIDSVRAAIRHLSETYREITGRSV